MEGRTGERSVRLLDDDDVDGAGQRRRIDFIIENAKVTYELANVVHTVHLTLTYHVSNHVPKCICLRRDIFTVYQAADCDDRKVGNRRDADIIVYPAVQRSSVETSVQSRHVELMRRLNHIET